VTSGRWPLWRYDPRRRERGQRPLQLDSSPPRGSMQEVWATEQRFRLLQDGATERSRALRQQAEADRNRRWALLQALAQLGDGGDGGDGPA